MKLEAARRMAESVLEEMRPFCERAEPTICPLAVIDSGNAAYVISAASTARRGGAGTPDGFLRTLRSFGFPDPVFCPRGAVLTENL